MYSDAIGFGGYLYIFDIKSPIDIRRIYPVRIPLNHYRIDKVVYAFTFYIGPLLLIAVIVVIVNRNRIRKQRKEKIINKSSNDDKSH